MLALGCEDEAHDMMHISQCERCSSLLRDALEDLPRDLTEEELSVAESIPPPPMPKARTTRWPLAIAAALFVLVSATAYRMVNPELEKPTLTAQLSNVYSAHRSMDLRIAGTRYSEVRVQRSASAKSPYADLALAIADELEKTPGQVKLLRDKGRLALFEGRYDEAIAILEPLVTVDPETETDLAAAYFQRGRRRNSQEDRDQAFVRYQAFVRSHPSDSAAAFNLALVAAETRPAEVAARFYEQYLALESSPEWKHEAEGRLARLREGLKPK